MENLARQLHKKQYNYKKNTTLLVVIKTAPRNPRNRPNIPEKKLYEHAPAETCTHSSIHNSSPVAAAQVLRGDTFLCGAHLGGSEAGRLCSRCTGRRWLCLPMTAQVVQRSKDDFQCFFDAMISVQVLL
jgi:hypothetical protein